MPTFSCPHCQKALQIGDHHPGAVVQCPECKKQFRIPKHEAPAAPAGRDFAWKEIATEIRNPWDPGGGPSEPGWPRPDQLDKEPLPADRPEEASQLGKPLASLEIGFAQRRSNRTIGWLLIAVAGLALLGAVGVLALKFGLNRPWSAAIGLLNCSLIVFVVAACIGTWLLLKARSTPAFRLWLCPRGLVWQKDESVNCCRWAELRNVYGGGTRIITIRRGGMFTDDKVVNREQFFAYLIALPNGNLLNFSTRQTRLAKPFMDRVQFEVIQALVPESGRRLSAGETLTFGPFRIDTRTVQHGQKQAGWGELGRIDLVKGSLLLYRADGAVWEEERMARVAHAPVFIKMAEILIEAHAGSRPQQDQANPFAF